MNSSTILLLAPLLLIIVGGFAWMALRRLSRIDEELRTITLLLNDVPKEISIRDYFYAQDRRLFDIREKLDTYSSNEVLQQYIRDQANQIIAFITTHDDSRKSGITKADLEASLQMTNRLLEKVLWALRFDEDKFIEDTDITNRDNAGEQGNEEIKIDTKNYKPSKSRDDDISMNSILSDSDDSYHAMLSYMQKTGESGVEALQALESAK